MYLLVFMGVSEDVNSMLIKLPKKNRPIILKNKNSYLFLTRKFVFAVSVLCIYSLKFIRVNSNYNAESCNAE